jgi:hypothetical protein
VTTISWTSRIRGTRAEIRRQPSSAIIATSLELAGGW